MNSKIEELARHLSAAGTPSSLSMVRADGVWCAKFRFGMKELRAEGLLFGIALERLDDECRDFLDGCPICSAPQSGTPHCPRHN